MFLCGPESEKCPTHVRPCLFIQFAHIKFSRQVRTLLHRKWRIRMKYKPVSKKRHVN